MEHWNIGTLERGGESNCLERKLKRVWKEKKRGCVVLCCVVGCGGKNEIVTRVGKKVCRG